MTQRNQARKLDRARGARLYLCGPCDVVEPCMPFSDRLASVTLIAREWCRTMALHSAARERLEAQDKALSLRLLAFLINRFPICEPPVG